jgi:hypothetical protein
MAFTTCAFENDEINIVKKYLNNSLLSPFMCEKEEVKFKKIVSLFHTRTHQLKSQKV